MIWTGIATVLAFGFAMTNFSLAGDDWIDIYGDSTRQPMTSVSVGRWLQALLLYVFDQASFAPFAAFAIGLAILVIAGTVAAATWRFQSGLAVFAVAALLVVNPTFSEPFSFEHHHLSLPLGVLAAILAGWAVVSWSAARWRRLVVASTLLMASLALYQSAVVAFGVIVLGHEVLRLIDDPTHWSRATARRWADIAMAAVGGIVVYLISVEVALAITGISKNTTSRYTLSGGFVSTPTEVADAFVFGMKFIVKFWIRESVWYPLSAKVMSLVLALGGLVAAARSIRADGRRMRQRAWLVVLAGGVMVAPFATLFIRTDPSTRYRVLTIVGLAIGFWAAVVAERGLGAPGWLDVLGRRVAAGLVALVVVAGAFQISSAYLTLHHENQRDLAVANRILSVIELHPEYPADGPVRVAVAGRLDFSVELFPFAEPGTGGRNILGCNVLDCQPKHLARLLNLIGSGHRYAAAYIVGKPQYAAAIASMPSWPARGSIQVIDGVFVVKGSG
jgi:hypothetical protein